MNSCAQGNHFLVYNSLKIENIRVNRVLTPFKPDYFCYLGFRLTKICLFFLLFHKYAQLFTVQWATSKGNFLITLFISRRLAVHYVETSFTLGVCM